MRIYLIISVTNEEKHDHNMKLLKYSRKIKIRIALKEEINYNLTITINLNGMNELNIINPSIILVDILLFAISLLINILYNGS